MGGSSTGEWTGVRLGRRQGVHAKTDQGDRQPEEHDRKKPAYSWHCNFP